MTKKTDEIGLNLLRITGWLEGISFIVLVGIAMPLKYWANKPEAVKIVGMAHGVLFIAYVVFLAWVAYQYKWKSMRTILAFVAAFVPFGTFWAEVKLFRGDSKF